MWEETLADYDRRHSSNKASEIAWFQRQPSLRAAIERAAHAVDECGRRYSHQYRIRRQAIAQATAALLAAEAEIASANSFDALLSLITGQLRQVSGTGELYLYDTAFRIGAHRRLFPMQVFLHRGTRDGARALGLPHDKDVLGMNELPDALRHRAPHEVEDILCIYKDAFRHGPSSGVGCMPAHRTSQRC